MWKLAYRGRRTRLTFIPLRQNTTCSAKNPGVVGRIKNDLWEVEGPAARLEITLNLSGGNKKGNKKPIHQIRERKSNYGSLKEGSALVEGGAEEGTRLVGVEEGVAVSALYPELASVAVTIEKGR